MQKLAESHWITIARLVLPIVCWAIATDCSVAQDSAAQDSAAQDSAAQDSAAQDSAAQDSAAQDSAAQDSAAQDSAAQDSAAQDSVAQDSAAQDADAASKPNIVLIVLDDAGQSDLGVYGSEIPTPNIDAIAERGALFTQFHVTPNCSTTRACLLTGMDHHRTGLGSHGSLAANQVGKPGYEGFLNDRVALLPEVLRDAGYRTLMAGKWHLGNKAPTTWPHSRGFDDSFVLIGGLASHWNDTIPLFPKFNPIYADNGRVVDELPDDFYSTDYYTDEIIEAIGESRQPFFAYLAFTAPHCPLHAPRELIEKYHATYRDGWDAHRLRRLARQKSLGLIPTDAKASPRPEWIPAWDSLDDGSQQILARDMAVYAAMIDRIDQSVGHVVAQLKTQGVYDNTCIVVMSDNGPNKTTMSDYLSFFGAETSYLDRFNNSLHNRGLPDSSIDHGPGWAYSLATPRRLMKGYPTEGGTLAPLIIKLPQQHAMKGNRITSPVHVMDLMPTFLELADAKHPAESDQSDLLGVQGESLLPLTRVAQSDDFESRGFGGELFGMKSFREGDWKIVGLPTPYGNDRWQLYNLQQDPGEVKDLASAEPERLEHLIRGYQAYAAKNGVVEPNERLSYARPPKPISQADYRQVKLDGQNNFRDVGGYVTEDGRSVALGKVFRSGALSKLSTADLERMEQVGIKTVVNFLTEDEMEAAGRDRVPAAVNQISAPIESDDGMVKVALDARRTGDFSKISADLNPAFHQMLVEQGKRQYAELYRAILDTDDPVVFHCSHGVHRTGSASAILLWSLGVPWDEVREDYLLSNQYRKAEVDKRIEQLRMLAAKSQAIAPEEVDMTNVNAFYRLEGSYIDATRDEILQEYGSIDDYLRKGLGLTAEEIAKLRTRLLE